MNEAPVVPPPGSPAEDFMVVGIGASAGGLKALIELFKQVPANPGMAFVVVVHLSPEHESRMSDILQQATTLPVRAVTRTVTIAPNHVYVISPKSLLRMYDGKLESTEIVGRGGGGRMTIDLFLETLAEAHRQRAVGIILSGTGSDGTLGVRSVKAHGGITIAQEPEEAEYDSMPRSAIASGVIDFVLPVAEIPERVLVLWRNARAIRMPALPDRPAPEDLAAEAEEAVRDILSTLRTRTGHDFSQYKRATLLRRLERRLQVNQIRNIPEYRDFVLEHPTESQALLGDLLITVTSFFRDPAAWQVIEQRVIPELFEGSEGRSIRVWVVGCATGEEVYSFAMLLQERMQTLADPPSVTLFATDIDEASLSVARAGLYSESIVEQMTPERLRRFFVREQGGYRVQKPLREMVMFAVHNVIQDPPFSRLDLVSCRNLLIYLTRHVQVKVLDFLHFSLRPDGYLFLGMSESIDDSHDGFTPIDKTHRVFVQQPRATGGLFLAARPAVQPLPVAKEIVDHAGRRLVSFGELHQRFLEHYAPPSIVVDDRFDIVHLSDRAGHFLQLGPGEPSLNLFRVAPEALRFDLRGALDQALASMLTVERRGIVMKRGPQTLHIDLKVHPVREKASGRTFALVILSEAGIESAAPTEEAQEAREFPATATAKLEERLHDMEAQLRAAVEQYEVQNEELKASNEELQATNEELRATTEELETGKEELQSINEELTTVNQELKNKVDETTRISDDLQNFVTATQIASMFVDRELRLMRYTPFAREIFNVIPSDIGRPMLDITHRLEGFDFERELERVFETLHAGEKEARSSDGRWYIVRFLPYRTTEDRIRGAVLTFIDITERKNAEATGRRTEAWARALVESVRDYAIITVDPEGRIQTWNSGARVIFGYEESEILGKNVELLFTPEDRAAGVPEEELRTAREAGRSEDDRWQLRNNGERFYASGILSPLENADVFGYVKVVRDLTTRQMASERRDEQLATERTRSSVAEDANRMKDDFLAMLSHELRNPLSVMLMQAEILLRTPEGKKSPRLTHAAKIIHEMVRAQAQLIDDMLDVSRARTGKLTIDRQLLPLTFIVSDSIGALRREAQQKNVALDVQISDAQLIVAADPVRVRQIAWNLLSNALKFTPAGGTIRVRLGRDGDDARLDVEDTGEGIAAEALPHVFEWFRQVQSRPALPHGGLGIGLALVRQLADLHEGRVEAYSAGPGRGARFSVWLPLQVTENTTAVRADAATLGSNTRLAGMHILVVDDSLENARALREVLQFEGARVVDTTAPDAIERAKKERFDLIISDIAMPDIHGYAMLKQIRESDMNAETPAIAYTGYGSPGDIERARAAGFSTHLTKPIQADALLATIRETTKKREAADD